MAQTIVLGLDGANWGVIQNWLEDGTLPNLKQLREKGTDAVSRSELPPVTCPNWKCYSTGKNPGSFGVFWWEAIEFAEREITFPDASSFRSSELWDYLGDEDISWASLNMPTTFPPRNIPNGEIIAGGPLCADNGYTSHPALEDELERRFGYRVFPSKTFQDKDTSKAKIDATLDLLEIRFDVAEWYLEEHEPEFFNITIFLLNYIQHFFWDGEPLKEAWKIIDEGIERLNEHCRNIILVSDHGSNEISTVFYINNWLEQQGYLTTRKDISNTLGEIGLTQERIKEIVNSIGVRDLAKKAPQPLKNLFPQEEGAKRGAKARMVRWDETSVLASGQGPIYVNKQSQEEIIGDIITELKNLKTPQGRPIASRVLRQNEAYYGDWTNIGPDIIVEQAPGIHITDGIGTSDIFTEPTRWRAENDRDGIFLAHGPDIMESHIDSISILDIAPTLLHLNDIPVPNDMEGDVLDIFSNNSDINSSDVTFRTPISVSGQLDNESGKAEQRLRDLGYLEQ